jgi:dihydroneopterin triphosphate diphosphatase
MGYLMMPVRAGVVSQLRFSRRSPYSSCLAQPDLVEHVAQKLSHRVKRSGGDAGRESHVRSGEDVLPSCQRCVAPVLGRGDTVVGESDVCLSSRYYAGGVTTDVSANSASGLLGRAAFQVLVFPYRATSAGDFVYALFRRADASYWQGVAGGGEEQETPLEAARREASEEAGIPSSTEFLALDSVATIPVVNVTGEFSWGPDVLVIPEHAFGARCERPELALSDEHTEYQWFGCDEAMKALRWDSNRNALWELNHRLVHGIT